MIVDTSALIAILRDEQDAMSYARAVAEATVRRISAANYVVGGHCLSRNRGKPRGQCVPELP